MSRWVAGGCFVVLLALSCSGRVEQTGFVAPAGSAGHGSSSAGAGATAGKSVDAGSSAGAAAVGGTQGGDGGSSSQGAGSAGVSGAGDTGSACSVNRDCLSEYCEQGTCADHCLSGVREADETDVDCGGAVCSPCEIARHCETAADCASSLCASNRCVAPTCTDQILNQDETDIDCGGICSPCADSSRCKSAADCESYVCTDNRCVADLTIAAADVIDDFEDSDFSLPLPAASHGNRLGSWYTFGDPSPGATINRDVATVNRGASLKALHTSGAGFNEWGSGLAVDFENDGVSIKGYDASGYTGITFWARAKQAANFRVGISNLDTDSRADGHRCMSCGHDWFVNLSLSTAWQRYTIAFNQLLVEAGNDPSPMTFDRSAVTSVTFVMTAGTSYDVSIDDVAFLK